LNGILLEAFASLAELIDLLGQLHLDGAGSGDASTVLKTNGLMNTCNTEHI
jgi:hypothetical protein